MPSNHALEPFEQVGNERKEFRSGVESGRPGMRAASESTGLIDIGAKRIGHSSRLPLEFMDGLNYTTIIEPGEPLARWRSSALDR